MAIIPPNQDSPRPLPAELRSESRMWALRTVKVVHIPGVTYKEGIRYQESKSGDYKIPFLVFDELTRQTKTVYLASKSVKSKLKLKASQFGEVAATNTDRIRETVLHILRAQQTSFARTEACRLYLSGTDQPDLGRVCKILGVRGIVQMNDALDLLNKIQQVAPVRNSDAVVQMLLRHPVIDAMLEGGDKAKAVLATLPFHLAQNAIKHMTSEISLTMEGFGASAPDFSQAKAAAVSVTIDGILQAPDEELKDVILEDLYSLCDNGFDHPNFDQAVHRVEDVFITQIQEAKSPHLQWSKAQAAIDKLRVMNKLRVNPSQHAEGFIDRLRREFAGIH